MILIISKEKLDPSTEDVIDWLYFFNKEFYRLNGDTLYDHENMFVDISHLEDIKLKIKSKNLNKNYSIAWYRRWSDREFIEKLPTHKLSIPHYQKILDVLVSDEAVCKNFFINAFNVQKWLTTPQTSHSNKLIALVGAKNFGLQIPHTIVTGKKTDIISFKKKYDKIINKDLSIPYVIFEEAGKRVASYTTELTDDKIKSLPEFFKPSIFQELIHKQYEIRTFYIAKNFYSMAIFSQLDKKTEVDFRNYNLKKPNRTVPYKLPQQIEDGLTKLMESLKFTTGSIDLIKVKNGSYVFLEINPIGQFGMTSYPCNYNIEKIIAEYLAKHDKN